MRLILAGLDDADYLLALRNDPVTRANSRSISEVPRERHMEWLAASLTDRSRRLYIAHGEHGERVGSGRLDRRHNEVELSITVNPAYRGKGYARKIVAALVANTNLGERLTAEIWNENTRCLLAFLHEGFVPITMRSDDRRWVWVERMT